MIFYDDAGTEVGRMNFYNCWPVKHTMPSAEAKNSGRASETIELAYEWYEWKGKWRKPHAAATQKPVLRFSYCRARSFLPSCP